MSPVSYGTLFKKWPLQGPYFRKLPRHSRIRKVGSAATLVWNGSLSSVQHEPPRAERTHSLGTAVLESRFGMARFRV